MEMDEEGLLRKLAEIGSGPGGATAGKADSGELYGLAGFFSAELRAAFERVKLHWRCWMTRLALTTPRMVAVCVSTAFPTSMKSETRMRHLTTACHNLRHGPRPTF